MAANWKYDELQRQVEKERIREEIIAEEIARRRILEEEVRRELMMEKKITFRTFEPSTMSFGCSCRISPFLAHEQSIIPCKVAQFYESRTGSPLASPVCRAIGFQGSENLPFQRHPDPVSAAGPSMGSNGIQPLLQPRKGASVLARLERNVSGRKRKSPIPEADQEWNNKNSTKKPKGWNCLLCNVVATSEIDLNLHRQGRKHKAKEAGLIAQERSNGATAVATECNSSNGKPSTVLLSTSDMGVKNTLKAGGESLESVHREAAEAGKQNNIRNMNIISYPRSTEKAREFDLCSNGDMPIKAMPSAKSSEKSTLWCDLCQVRTTCPKDMSAHEAGKKHLARLHKDISAKEMSCSSKSLSKSRDAQGINGGDVLPKVAAKEMTQNRLESTFIPFEMKEMLNANVVVTSRDNGSCVVVRVERDANTAMVSTSDPGVKMTFKTDVKSSENVVCQAAAAKQNSIEKSKGKIDPTQNPKAKDVDSNGNGDTSGPQTKLLSAKPQEKIMFSSEMCRVVAASSSSPKKPLFMEKVAEGIKVGNVLPKETKETEKEVMQVGQESNVIPSEVEETAKNTIDGTGRGDANCALYPLSATCESGLDEHKPGRNEKAREAALVVQKTVTPSPEESVVTLGVKKVIKAKQGRYANATRKGDAPGSRKKASAKPCEKLKLWYQMSQVGTSSAEGLHDNKLYDEGALPDVSWFIEEVVEAGKDAVQDE